MKDIHVAAALCLSLLAGCHERPGTKALHPGDAFEVDVKPGEAHDYSVALGAGESALAVIRQMGADLVVEVRDPDGKLFATVDSPNGRNGDEVVLLEPERQGTYLLRVRPFDGNEPAAKYAVTLPWRRDAQSTVAAVVDARRWFRDRSAEIPPAGAVSHTASIPVLDPWLGGRRVVGLGEATHGSRELGDLRVSLTKLLIEQYGFRAVAIEASADKYDALAAYIAGERATPSPGLPGPGWIWIGRRSQRELIAWVRAWNLAHPADRVRIVGVDANDNALARAALDRFVAQAYRSTDLEREWPAASADLAAADEQSFVFGDSGVTQATWDLLARIDAGTNADVQESLAIVREFAAFNAQGDIGDVPRARDVHMARRVLRVLNEGGPTTKAIYWAHNAHVVHSQNATSIAGTVLRRELGAGYGAIATTFGEGAFLAQIPNNAEDRLAVSRVPMAPSGTVEGMLATVRAAGSLVLWQTDLAPAEVPTWSQLPRRMHWVGGLYRPDTDPGDAFQAYILMSDFDGIAYLPKTTAEDIIPQPHIPARSQGGAR